MYSNIRLLDAINRPKDLITTAYKLGLSGIALTDHECLCGAVEWLDCEKSLKKDGKIPESFKCLIGNEIYLTDSRDKNQKYWHFILIAKDTVGFRQLCELSSKSWYESYFDRQMERVPTLKSELKALVMKNRGHLIASSACLGGECNSMILDLARAEQVNNIERKNQLRIKIQNFIEYCKELFGDDFYLEIAPGLTDDQITYNRKAKQIARIFNLKIILGCDAHYLRPKDRTVHKAYLNSKEGEREVDEYYASCYLHSNEEAYEKLKDIYSEHEFEEICNNTMEIYEKVQKYEIFHSPIIPEVDVMNYPRIKSDNDFSNNYPVLAALFDSENPQERYWVNYCVEELNRRGLVGSIYFKRLETEADIIKTVGTKLGNCLFSYFNTFQHFIDLFWDCGSLSGPGRGSSVCFLSNYLLGITQLDPIKYNLMEWRFLNKERLELPDIDTDLSPSKRPLILKKIRQEFGETRVLQVATFGTETTKSAILTACRGYRSNSQPNGIDVDTAAYISSLIPQERGFLWPLNDVVNGNEEKDRKPSQPFLEEVNKYPGLLDIMFGIEGLVNKRSQHASGVILYNKDPWETGAMMKSPNGDLITQFSLHCAESLGDTKFDFLVTEICDKITNEINLLKDNGYFSDCSSLREIYNKYLHPEKIDVKDSRLWNKLGEGSVIDLFQFDSDVGGQAIKSIKPQSPIELMMANALTRLAGEKDKERPIDRYVRMKNDISRWYSECNEWGLTEQEVKNLEKYYLPVYGTPTTQEKLMLLCMDENIGHFTLKEANAARKICARFFGV